MSLSLALALVLFGIAIAWWGACALYIAIKTKGKITPLELAFHSLFLAATVTETYRIPRYTPNWREEWKADAES